MAWNESDELAEKGFLTSSCCPAFVEYVTKFFPKMLDKVSHNPSPMAAMGRYIKSTDPTANRPLHRQEKRIPQGNGAAFCGLRADL